MANAAQVYLLLKDAIGTGEVVGIVYNGGSQPGAYREIIPLQIVERQVRAKCRMSNKAKVFNLDKIEIRGMPPAQGEAVATWDIQAPPAVDLATIAEIEAAHRDALEAVGWHVVCVTDEDGQRLCLHRWTKDRSRPLKHPAVHLRFSPMTYDFEACDVGGYRRTNRRPNARPWGVGAGASPVGGPWKFPAKAIEAFLRAAAAF